MFPHFSMSFFPFLLHMKCKYSILSTNLRLWRDELRGSIRVEVSENISRGIFILLNSEFYGFYTFLFFRYPHIHTHRITKLSSNAIWCVWSWETLVELWKASPLTSPEYEWLCGDRMMSEYATGWFHSGSPYIHKYVGINWRSIRKSLLSIIKKSKHVHTSNTHSDYVWQENEMSSIFSLHRIQSTSSSSKPQVKP